ncbi:MAG: hypothetical protein AAF153_03555, partial [Pseudomonadota bacterium]
APQPACQICSLKDSAIGLAYDAFNEVIKYAGVITDNPAMKMMKQFTSQILSKLSHLSEDLAKANQILGCTTESCVEKHPSGVHRSEHAIVKNSCVDLPIGVPPPLMYEDYEDDNLRPTARPVCQAGQDQGKPYIAQGCVTPRSEPSSFTRPRYEVALREIIYECTSRNNKNCIEFYKNGAKLSSAVTSDEPNIQRLPDCDGAGNALCVKRVSTTFNYRGPYNTSYFEPTDDSGEYFPYMIDANEPREISIAPISGDLNAYSTSTVPLTLNGVGSTNVDMKLNPEEDRYACLYYDNTGGNKQELDCFLRAGNDGHHHSSLRPPHEILCRLRRY